MSYLLNLSLSQCFQNIWIPVYGVYWAVSMIDYQNSKALIHMARTSGKSCPGGADETHKVLYPMYGPPSYFDNGRLEVEISRTEDKSVTIKITEVPKEPEDPGFGFGRAEITQTNIGNGLIFDIGSKIECSLRVMNTGENGKIYGAVGLGYHDKEGRVFFTGRYMIDNVEIPKGETHTWNPSIEVLHKDYAAREMTPRGPAVYFMAGHEENKNVVWDRSEYIPVELILESGYVDPTDPDGVPDDWDEPVHDPSRPWDFISDIIPEISKFVDDLIPEKEPEEKEEPIDIMPFIYIGFMGLIGYLLIKEK